jgi:molybdate transport system regulatory protein
MASPVVRFRIDFADHAAVGPGKIALLEAVHASGSLSQAARNLGMSYRRAWLLIASLNASFRKPVARAVTGGRGGGGATLTEFGVELITSYRALDRDISSIAARHLRPIVKAVTKASRVKPAVARRSFAHKGI